LFGTWLLKLGNSVRSTAITLCKHMVSGLFHRPHRAAFHLSLTVLVHYRSSKVFSLAG